MIAIAQTMRSASGVFRRGTKVTWGQIVRPEWANGTRAARPEIGRRHSRGAETKVTPREVAELRDARTARNVI